MWRTIFTVLKWLWVALILGGVALPLTADCLRGLILGEGCAPWSPALTFIRTYGLWVGLILLALAGLTLIAWLADRRHRAREKAAEQAQEARESFDLLKPANELRPEDLNFQVLTEPGQHLSQDRRPLYESAYIPRIAVAYEDRADKNPRQIHEDDLLEALQKNRGFILQGQPLDGKSHTLYEIVRRMDGYQVLRPRRDDRVPEEEYFSLLLKEQKVVLLLDNLSEYVGSDLNLYKFGQRLSGCKMDWVVASTCRDGSRLETVKQAAGNNLREFYEQVPQKLKLLQLVPEEKGQLAESIGKRWDPEENDQYPTPGSITMEGHIRFMKNRFENDLTHEQRDILRALKLLDVAGVLPLSQERIQAVLEHVFKRSPSHLGDCLNKLADEAFLHPGSQEPVEPEPAYLRDAVNYTEGKDSMDDFPQLMAVLDEELQDHEGLVYLGNSYYPNLKNSEEACEKALVCYDKALYHRPDYPEAWYSKGNALGILGQYKKAIEAYDKAINLKSDYPEAWNHKGIALRALGRPEEAVEAHTKALEALRAYANRLATSFRT